MGEVTTHEDNIIERVAIEYHGFDGDEYTLSWGKNKSSYRGSVRKMVRTVFASATRVGLTVVSAKSIAAKDAEIEALKARLTEERSAYSMAYGVFATETSRLREALVEAKGWVVLAEDFGRDTTRALALVDAALEGGSDAE